MKAYFIGGGIGSLAGAAFLIRDGGVSGGNIIIYEALPLLGGSLDGAQMPDGSYSLRGGRMLTTDHYGCTWDLLSSIPSLEHRGQTVREETLVFNVENKAHSRARPQPLQGGRLDDGFRHAGPDGTGPADRGVGGESSAIAASRTGCPRRSSRPTSGPCGKRPSPFSPGTAQSSSSAIFTAS
jgi:MCRA family protein